MKNGTSISAFLIVGLAGLLLFLSGCGQPVCVAGFGQCTQLDRKKPDTSTTASSDKLEMKVPTTRVLKGEKLNFTASGGLKPYVFSLVAGGGEINSETGIYTAPQNRTSATIRVTDANNKTYDIAIIIELPEDRGNN